MTRTPYDSEAAATRRAADVVAGADLLIFDFDGTLADSEALLTEMVLSTFADADLPPALDRGEIARLIGLPLAQVLSRTGDVPPARLDELVALYRRRADAPEVIARFRLFPGVLSTLRALQERGKSLAVATSKSRHITLKILAAVGVDDLIHTVVGGDSVTRGKPHPEMVGRVLAEVGTEPARAVVVGDTTFDVEMGQAAGVPTIAVTYGMHDRAALAALRPDALIDAVDELIGG